MRKKRMNYEIVNENGLFWVMETQTEHFIRSFVFFKDAKMYMNKLNAGGAFDGWTPKFFLK